MTAVAESFCAGDPLALRIHERVVEVLAELGDVDTRVCASQVAYRRGRTFALVWRPGRYLRSRVPLVLSLGLREPLRSDRFKEVVQVAPSTWMHHLELRAAAEVDDEVRSWIRLAWEEAADTAARSISGTRVPGRGTCGPAGRAPAGSRIGVGHRPREVEEGR